MKLVEILARELNEWPMCDFIVQDDDGQCWPSMNGSSHYSNGLWATNIFKYNDFVLDKSEDNSQSKVTREQWQAEREHISKLKEIEKIVYAGGAVTPSDKQWSNESKKQCEQELWDKVAAEVFVDVLAISATSEGGAICACNAADAFMAERAKHMKDNQKT